MQASKVDARPGRLVWAKVGDWPWWPAKVTAVDQVPQKIMEALNNKASDKGILVKFFEDPPKYQRVPEKFLRPWNAFFEAFSKDKTKNFAKALSDAMRYHQDLDDSLQSDGEVGTLVVATKAKKAKAAPAEVAAPTALQYEPLLDNDLALLQARRELGAALLAQDVQRVLNAVGLLCRFQTSEKVMQTLELGKIATLLTKHDDPQIARAGKDYVAHLSGLLVLQRMKND